MSKEIIDRLNKHIQFCMDRKTEAYERDAALIRDAVARIAELEAEVLRQKELRKQADEQRIQADEDRRNAEKIAREAYYQELQAKIAGLEQQNAELSKDKARIDAIVEYAMREEHCTKEQAIELIDKGIAEVCRLIKEREHE